MSDGGPYTFQTKVGWCWFIVRPVNCVITRIAPDSTFGVLFLLKGQVIIQQLCKVKLDFGNLIDERIAVTDLQAVKEMNVPRCCKAPDFR